MKKTVNGVIFKVIYHEIIIRTTNFLFHKHSDYKHKQGAGGGGRVMGERFMGECHIETHVGD